MDCGWSELDERGRHEKNPSGSAAGAKVETPSGNNRRIPPLTNIRRVPPFVKRTGAASHVDTPKPTVTAFSQRPQRADALRNYEKLISAAREAFTEDGASASLEDIARRARVGIGTLYRHFPTRQHLLEAVYVDEVEAICRAAADLADLAPWDALVAWLRAVRRLRRHQARDRAGAARARSTPMPRSSARAASAITTAGESLLQRAQEAGAVRADANFSDIARLLGGIAAIRVRPRADRADPRPRARRPALPARPLLTGMSLLHTWR